MSVYFIRCGRYIKVGFSRNPERRCKNLWQGSTRGTRPWDLSIKEERTLLLTIDGDKSVEWRCHTALSDYWANGEWFIDEPGIHDFMEQAARGRFPVAVRPGGRFEPVGHEHMIQERRDEIDRAIARERLKRGAA